MVMDRLVPIVKESTLLYHLTSNFTLFKRCDGQISTNGQRVYLSDMKCTLTVVDYWTVSVILQYPQRAYRIMQFNAVLLNEIQFIQNRSVTKKCSASAILQCLMQYISLAQRVI